VKHVSSRDFALAACQATAYTPDGESNASRVLAELAPRWRDRLDADPQVAAHPASPHPRVLLRSGSGAWRCEIDATRADLYWLRPDARAPAPSVADFFAAATRVLVEYAEVTGARIGRFAAIVNRGAAHSAPGLFIGKHFLRGDLGGGITRAESVEIDLHDRRALGPFLVNAWLRCRTPDDPDPAARRIVQLVQDLNTLGEDAGASAYTSDEIREFMSLAASEHERVLAQFFPEAP
jgi:hypothetical protein